MFRGKFAFLYFSSFELNFDINCLSNLNPTFYSIDIGLHDIINKESWYINRKVSRVIVHENYDDYLLHNDITLMKLSVCKNFEKKK